MLAACRCRTGSGPTRFVPSFGGARLAALFGRWKVCVPGSSRALTFQASVGLERTPSGRAGTTMLSDPENPGLVDGCGQDGACTGNKIGLRAVPDWRCVPRASKERPPNGSPTGRLVQGLMFKLGGQSRTFSTIISFFLLWLARHAMEIALLFAVPSIFRKKEQIDGRAEGDTPYQIQNVSLEATASHPFQLPLPHQASFLALAIQHGHLNLYRAPSTSKSSNYLHHTEVKSGKPLNRPRSIARDICPPPPSNPLTPRESSFCSTTHAPTRDLLCILLPCPNTT